MGLSSHAATVTRKSRSTKLLDVFSTLNVQHSADAVVSCADSALAPYGGETMCKTTFGGGDAQTAMESQVNGALQASMAEYRYVTTFAQQHATPATWQYPLAPAQAAQQATGSGR